MIEINLVPMYGDDVFGYVRNFNIRDAKMSIHVNKAETEIKRIVLEGDLAFQQVNMLYKDRRYLCLLCGRSGAVQSMGRILGEGEFRTGLSPMFDSPRIIAWMPYDKRHSAPGYMILRSGNHSLIEHEARMKKYLEDIPMRKTG